MQSADFFAMNTEISIKCYGLNAKKSIEQIKQKLTETENLVSPFINGSDVKNINDNAGIKPCKVNKITFDLIKKSVSLCEISDGNFDITVGPVSFLWKDFFETANLPTDDEIAANVKLINYKDVFFDEQAQTIFLKNPKMKLDLGGVAKGYVCNYFNQILANNKITSAIISIGGNVYTYKNKPDNSRYTLGIRDPNGTANDFVGKLVTTDTVVATSGAYERFLIKDNKTYHHIIDIKTGLPSNSDLLSVTVVAKDGALADFLSTTIYLSGLNEINKHLNQDNYSVLIIDKNNNVYLSENLKPDFNISNNNYKIVK